MSKRDTNTNRTYHKDLPKSFCDRITSNCYSFSHSCDDIDTNLLIFFHGMGDSCRGSLCNSFAKGMQLPQTALLSLDASLILKCNDSQRQGEHLGFVELPFDLGYTWFLEHDLSMDGLMKSLSVSQQGNNSLFSDLIRLSYSNSTRIKSLKRAVDIIQMVIDSLTDTWSTDRMFLFGYSCGASLAAEVSCERALNKMPKMGGAIAVAGGPSLQQNSFRRKEEYNDCGVTPLLIIAGSKDTSFPVSRANECVRIYNIMPHNQSNNVPRAQVYVKKGKEHDMIRSKDEMDQVMKFFAKHLVRRMIEFEKQGFEEVKLYQN